MIHRPIELTTRNLIFSRMGLALIAENKQRDMNMERPGNRSGQQGAASTRVERKTMEKNRRNRMKSLYSMLNTLVPGNSNDQGQKEAKSLPDRIDEAVKYIKYLEATVKEAQKKKDGLTARKRLRHSNGDSCSASNSIRENFRSPRVDVRVHGSSLEVALTSGICNQFIFSDVIRVLHEEQAEVLNANFSIIGCSVYHLMHAEVGEGNRAAAITERLKRLVNGSTSNDSHQFHQQQHHLWDFEISPNIWEFDMFHAWHSTQSI